MKLRVNGKDHNVDVDADCPLLYVLRNDLDLKGTRFGCGEASCGACMVLVDGRAAFSCDTPLWAVEGKEVTTVEALLASPDSQSLFDAFVDEQAAQCGYCLSGIIVSAEALMRDEATPDREAIAAALKCNLCRCGTHMRIIKAIERAAATRQAMTS